MSSSLSFSGWSPPKVMTVLWAGVANAVSAAADGTALYQGQVTDEAGFAGPAGAATSTGDTGPWVLAGSDGTQLYEGGLVALTTALIG